MRYIRRIKFILPLYLIVVALLLFTNPQHLPLALLLLPLLVFFVALFLTIKMLMEHFARDNGASPTSKKQAVLAAIIAGFPVLCLLLKSVGQMSVRDFIILLVMFGLLGFYVNRMNSKNI